MSDSIYFHFIAHNWRRHLAYCCLAVNRLIQRGNVNPSRIVVSLSRCLMGSPEAGTLIVMGVVLNPITDGYTQKWIALDTVFRLYPRAESIMQLDADCILTEETDLPGRVAQLMHGPHNLMAHQGDTNWQRHFHLRHSLFIPAFNPSHHEGAHRLDAMLYALAGIRLQSWMDWLESWVLGGIVLIRRDLFHQPVWATIQALAWLTRCDESVIQFARHAWNGERGEGMGFAYLSRAELPQRVNERVLDLWSYAPGFSHFSGDWYREHNPANKEAINMALNAATGLLIPDDAPVGPAREGGYDATKDPAWRPIAAPQRLT